MARGVCLLAPSGSGRQSLASMTRVVTIRTDHEDMAAAVEALAPHVSETSISMTMPEAMDVGEWARFRWLLRDGTVFWEGVGRAASSRPAGERCTVVLESLSFDARNEAMFERIQLGLEEGRRTGAHPQVPKAESVRPVPRYSSVPPPPRRAAPPAPPPAKLPPMVKAGLRPKPGAPPRPAMKPGGVAASAELAERARVLSRQLNLAAPSLARGRWTEERVLEAALRMGIEALEGLIAARDAGG